jgi:hypothetical protein
VVVVALALVDMAIDLIDVALGVVGVALILVESALTLVEEVAVDVVDVALDWVDVAVDWVDVALDGKLHDKVTLRPVKIGRLSVHGTGPGPAPRHPPTHRGAQRWRRRLLQVCRHQPMAVVVI